MKYSKPINSSTSFKVSPSVGMVFTFIKLVLVKKDHLSSYKV